MTETQKESKKEARSSWLSIVLDLAFRHAREIVGGALAIAGTIENDVRAFVVKFVRDMVLGIVLLFIGLGFIVFGVGVMLVEVLHLGPSAGPVVVGVFFVAMGAIVFLFSRR
jgi:hypothetical protein